VYLIIITKVADVPFHKKGLKMPKGETEAVIRKRTDKAMVKSKNTSSDKKKHT